MATKTLNSRIILKHDTEENWSKAENFIPRQGEIIVYDVDDGYNYERFKIGDGVTNVNALPFSGEENSTLLVTFTPTGVDEENNLIGTASHSALDAWNNITSGKNVIGFINLGINNGTPLGFILTPMTVQTTDTGEFRLAFFGGGAGADTRIILTDNQFKLTLYAYPTIDQSETDGNTYNINISGNAASATKLETAKTIGVSGYASGTAQSFDGSANINIPINSFKENAVEWGGPGLSGRVSPVDVAMNEEFSANRLAYLPANDIVVEYSNDAGATWTDYGLTNSQKQSLTTLNQSVVIGKRTKAADVTVNDQVRVTITASSNVTYFSLKKILLRVSTNGATGTKVLIEASKNGTDTTYSTIGTYDVSGWSGWNSIPYSCPFGGGDNQTSNIRRIRLTFSIEGLSTSSNLFQCMAIRMYGENSWANSGGTMAANGHMYSYDINKNVTFPANVTAPTFNGSLSGNATSATKDSEGNIITETYAKKTDIAVTSVNEKTGVVVLNASDVGAVAIEDLGRITEGEIDIICGEILEVSEVSY